MRLPGHGPFRLDEPTNPWHNMHDGLGVLEPGRGGAVAAAGVIAGAPAFLRAQNLNSKRVDTHSAATATTDLGFSNFLELVGDPNAFARTNRDVLAPPPGEFFTTWR